MAFLNLISHDDLDSMGNDKDVWNLLQESSDIY